MSSAFPDHPGCSSRKRPESDPSLKAVVEVTSGNLSERPILSALPKSADPRTANPAGLSRALPPMAATPGAELTPGAAGPPPPPPSEGPGGCPRKGPRRQLSGHCPPRPRPAPGHLPGRGGRRALPVLAPPVQPRRGERAQPGGHGAGLLLPARRGPPAPTGRRTPASEGRCGGGQPPTAGLGRRTPGVRGAPRPPPLCTGAHVTHCDLQRAAESTPNRKDIVPAAGAAQ